MSYISPDTRFVMLTNLSSSSAVTLTDELPSLLAQYGYADPIMLTGQSSDMGAMLSDMQAAHGDVLVSYGGDGTAAAVAAIARTQNVPFIPLPGGTMNMLSLSLYGSEDWRICFLKALAVSAPRPMTAGRVTAENKPSESFLVGAIFGQSVRLNTAREELREGHVLEAAREALNVIKTSSQAARLDIITDETTLSDRAYTLINILCPFMHGDALDPNRLDLLLFDQVTGGNALSLGFAALMGNLRRSQIVDHVMARAIQLRGDGTLEALLDGERHVFEGEVTVQIDKNHGLVLAPYPALSFPTTHRS